MQSEHVGNDLEVLCRAFRPSGGVDLLKMAKDDTELRYIHPPLPQ